MELSKAAVRRIAKADSEQLCVGCLEPLGDSRVVRGCHEKCFRATLRAIERGDVTEETRVAEGKLLAAGTRGRKPSNPVTIDSRKEP